MPEIISKHPEIVIKVLESQGAKCGDGIKPKILTKCAPEKFCKLDGGELCVFGQNEVAKTTQLDKSELCATRSSSTNAPDAIQVSSIALPLALLVGAIIWRRRARTPAER